MALPVTKDNIGTPLFRRGLITSWLLNGKDYIIHTKDAIYLSLVGLGQAEFDPNRVIEVIG